MQEFIRVTNFSDSFSISLTPELTYPDYQKRGSHRWLGLTFNALDRENLFFKALGVFDPAAAVGGQIPVNEYNEGKWDELMAQSEESLVQATVHFPMLRRLEKEYEDAFYAPDEIQALRAESETISSQSSDVDVVASIDKLVQACDEALRAKFGLFFASN